MRNTGLDLEKEKLELKGDEWVFGAASPTCLFFVPEKEREKYLPIGELQNIGEEKSGCVSRAYINILETKFTYAYQNNLLTLENKKWLEDNKYIENNRVVFADANVEILSGTTRVGNSLKAPIDTLRKVGLVPKYMLPQLSTWDEHYNPNRITDEVKNLGLEFVKRFAISYEQVKVSDLTNLLIHDTVALALHAWPAPINGEYPRVDHPLNHCVVGYALPLTYIFDNYLDDGKQGDFIKKLMSNYNLYEYGYRVYVSGQDSPKERLSIISKILNAIAEALGLISKQVENLPKPIPMPSPNIPKPVKESRIVKWAEAIKAFEGWSEGSASYRRNNPGNIKGNDGKFLVFKTYEAGFNYLCDYLTRACKGQHKAYKPDMTLYQFFKIYAPDPEPIPTNYSSFVAKKLGVFPSVKIKDLL